MISPTIQEAVEKREAQAPQIIPSVPGGVFLGGNLLPQAADELSYELGLNVFAKMDSEPAISGADFILRALVTECGFTIAAAVDEPSDRSRKAAAVQARKDFKIADDVRGFIQRVMDQMETPLNRVLWDSLEAWTEGHKLFEQVRELKRDDDGTMQVFTTAIKPKPRSQYQFAVTRFMDVVGVVPSRFGLLIEDFPKKATPEQWQALVPPENLLVVSLRGKNGDPRGTAAKVAAYDPWRRKQLAKPESVKNMTLFGSGRISIEGPPPNKDVVVSKEITVGGVTYSMTDYIASQAQFIRNGSYIILPDGWKMMDHKGTTGSHDIFETMFDRCDREMTMALLTVTRATQEAKHGSKADSETAEGLLGKLVNWLRQVLRGEIPRQVFRYLVQIKYGEEIARKFTPKLIMETAQEKDIPALLTALAGALASGAVTPEQMPFWDREVGQPIRDMDDQADPTADPQEDPAVKGKPAPAKKPQLAGHKFKKGGRFDDK